MSRKNYLLIIFAVLIVIFVVLLASRSASKVAPETTVVPDTSGTPAVSENNATVSESGDSAVPDLSPEIVFKVNGSSFTPKSIEGVPNQNTFLTFVSEDGGEHVFAFDDKSLAYITVSFDGELSKSINFPTPPAGSYSFHFDSPDNKGFMTVK
jgi:hypothetical protein